MEFHQDQVTNLWCGESGCSNQLIVEWVLWARVVNVAGKWIG